MAVQTSVETNKPDIVRSQKSWVLFHEYIRANLEPRRSLDRLDTVRPVGIHDDNLPTIHLAAIEDFTGDKARSRVLAVDPQVLFGYDGQLFYERPDAPVSIDELAFHDARLIGVDEPRDLDLNAGHSSLRQRRLHRLFAGLFGQLFEDFQEDVVGIETFGLGFEVENDAVAEGG